MVRGSAIHSGLAPEVEVSGCFISHNVIYVNMLGFIIKKPYFCERIKDYIIMAIEIKPIPVLRGKAAARFVEEADRNAKERRGSIDFTKQVAKMRAILKRSRLYREG